MLQTFYSVHHYSNPTFYLMMMIITIIIINMIVFAVMHIKNVLVGECLPLRKSKIVFATAKSNSRITCRGLVGGVNVSIAIYIRRLKEVT